MHHRAVTVDDNRPAERSFGSGLCSVNNHLHRRAYFRSTREPSFTYTLLGYAPLVQLRLYRAVRATVSNALVVSYWHKAEVFGPQRRNQADSPDAEQWATTRSLRA